MSTNPTNTSETRSVVLNLQERNWPTRTFSVRPARNSSIPFTTSRNKISCKIENHSRIRLQHNAKWKLNDSNYYTWKIRIRHVLTLKNLKGFSNMMHLSNKFQVGTIRKGKQKPSLFWNCQTNNLKIFENSNLINKCGSLSKSFHVSHISTRSLHVTNFIPPPWPKWTCSETSKSHSPTGCLA